MKDKICFITGSTDGIGKATAMSLAAKGSVVILHGKDKIKGEKAVEDLKEKMFNKNIFFEQCDLSDLAAVKDLARRLNKNYPALDVLINNAGIFTNKFELTKNGIEKQFAVNYLSHFLLTNLLIDSFNDNSRIINVSSVIHKRKGTNINFEDLNLKKNYSAVKAYQQSKLANILFTYELARRLEKDASLLKNRKITVNALHPGVVKTDITVKNYGKFFKILKNIANPFLMNVEKGAETSIFLASNKSVANITSKYFIKKTAVQSSEESYNMQTANRLWNVSLVLVNDFI